MNEKHPDFLSHMAISEIAEYAHHRAIAKHHLYQLQKWAAEIKSADREDQAHRLLESPQFKDNFGEDPEIFSEIERSLEGYFRSELDDLRARDLKHASGC